MSAPLLSYRISPDRAFVALQTMFTLTITNPEGGAPVTLKGGRKGDQIVVNFPCPPAQIGADALVDVIDFTAQSMTAGFTAGQDKPGSTDFVVLPVGEFQVLQPGASIQVVFNPVTVNGTPGTPRLTVTEYIGTNKPSVGLTITKAPQELAVIAWLDPYVVGKGQVSTLYWQSFGGTSVTVFGFPDGTGSRIFPVSGQPPYPGNCPVTVPATDPQRTYTLQVTTNDGRHAQDEVTLTQHAPLISAFGPYPAASSVSPAQTVDLTWTTQYGSRVWLQNNAGDSTAVAANPLIPYPVSPGKDAVQSAGSQSQIPAQVSYSLIAEGFGKPARATCGFTIEPALLLYFKYADRDAQGHLSGLTFLTDPADWPSNMTLAGDGGVLTVYQPGGGSLVAYLGSADTTHPQVRYFAATVDAGAIALTWVTANVTALRLDPPGQDIVAADIPQGSLAVKPTERTTYVLTATAANGTTISSALVVTP